MDRGGVKPLEQGGNPTPENRSDSALVHEIDTINIIKNRKAPKLGALRSYERSRSKQAYHLDTSIS